MTPSLQTIVIRQGKLERRACFAVAEAMDAEGILSASELEHLGSLQFSAKKQSFLLGRLAAKSAIGGLLAEPEPRCIEIMSGIFGQPLIQHPRAGALDVSLSHSHGLAVALAFPREVPMGVDLETVAAISAVTILGELALSAPEQAWLAADAGDVSTACAVLWTAREALGKLLKNGLQCPLGILALGEIQAAGAGTWVGRYLNFPGCRCLLQAIDGRVLSLALPNEVELSEWPRLC